MLLFDRILESIIVYGNTGVGTPGWIYDADYQMLQAVPIKIDNLIINLDIKTRKRIADYDYFPSSVIPPFKFSFIDSCTSSSNDIRFGIHVSCSDNQIENKKITDYLINLGSGILLEKKNYEELNAKYLLNFCFFENSIKNDIMTITPNYTLFLDKNGNIIKYSQQTCGMWRKQHDDGEGEEYQNRKMYNYLLVKIALFVFALMNCKNIIIEKTNAPKEDQIVRMREIGLPLVTYRIIKVNQTLIKKGNIIETQKNEPYMPLHICRGNFATYTEKNPLFGKYIGTFWRPQHFKGNEKFGKVIKEYHV